MKKVWPDLADMYTRKAKGTVRTEYLAIITGSLEFYSETGSNVYHLPDVTLFRETLYERNNRNQDHQLFNETFIHTRRGNMGQSITKDEREREARNVSPTFPLEIFSTKIVDYRDNRRYRDFQPHPLSVAIVSYRDRFVPRLISKMYPRELKHRYRT